MAKLQNSCVVDLPIPEVIPHHVLIRVLATSVNPVDYKIRSGIVPDIAPDFPAVLHGDVAGIIEKVGEGVNNFQPGDEVYGCAGGVKGMGGALAEYMLADAALIAKKPKSLNMRETAALPLVAITAWEGLIQRANILHRTNYINLWWYWWCRTYSLTIGKILWCLRYMLRFLTQKKHKLL